MNEIETPAREKQRLSTIDEARKEFNAWFEKKGWPMLHKMGHYHCQAETASWIAWLAAKGLAEK